MVRFSRIRSHIANNLGGYLAVFVAAWALAWRTAPASAISFGAPDGSAHPNVGAIIAGDTEPDATLMSGFCTGTLISPTVFLTAAHCTDHFEANGHNAWVTFDAQITQGGTFIPVTMHTNPEWVFYKDFGMAHNYDIAVATFEFPLASPAPAALPVAGLLDGRNLRNDYFTVVGYGAVRTSKKGGPNAFEDPNNYQRNVATRSFQSLKANWLTLSGNEATGSGGTCYGDSGGPHFLNASDTVVSTTIRGDAVCRAMTETLRLDTPQARRFLGAYVTLP
jgi:V8-like Glu-specific endopeptidase